MRSAESPPVLSIGELLIDLIATDGATSLGDATAFAARPGGAPANSAVALRRLGVPAAFCGVVGDDPFGERLRQTLMAENVDVSRLRKTPDAATTLAFAWKDAGGDGRFQLVRLADVLLDNTDIARAGIDALSAIVLGSVSLAGEPARSAIVAAAEQAVAAAVPVCIDVNMRPSIWPSPKEARLACSPVLERATLIKLSLDDAKFLLAGVETPEQAFKAMASLPARIVVLTDGARGAWFRDDWSGESTVRFIPAVKVDAIDPTGAGDAFTAAIIASLIENSWRRLTEDNMRFASAAGALTTTRRGAIAALPHKDEIAHFLAAQHQRPA